VEVSVADRSVARRATILSVSFINKVPLETDAIYLSDLKAVKAFGHAD